MAARRAALRARAVLPLPQRPPQPDQLERRGLRPRGDDDRRHRRCCAATTTCTCAASWPACTGPGWPTTRAPVLRRLDQPRPGLPLPLPDRPARPATRFNLDSRRVREHHRALPALVRAGARRGHAGAAARRPRGCCAAWVERVLLGYWTHSGFLNWDSGLGLKRWQIGKTFAFAQQGLLAIARADDFHAAPGVRARGRSTSSTAAWRSTRAGPTRRAAARSRPAVAQRRPRRVGGGDASKLLFGARMAANAARAIDLGLGRAHAQQPPPVYAYDPDIGRLAVSTPAYSTAMLAANHGAVAYGGIELARLYDGDGRPVATIGGRPPAAFGVVVRDVANRTLLASQTEPRCSRAWPRPPLRLTRAPRGTGHVVAHPRHAYAAPFQRLDARGVVAAGDVRVAHGASLPCRVRRDHVDRDVGRRARAAASTCSSPRGRARRRSTPCCTTARASPLGRGPVSLARVAWFHLRGEHSGYVVVVADRTAMHATARTLATAPQRYEPRPGSDAGAAPRARRALPPAHAHRAHRPGARRRRGRARGGGAQRSLKSRCPQPAQAQSTLRRRRPGRPGRPRRGSPRPRASGTRRSRRGSPRRRAGRSVTHAIRAAGGGAGAAASDGWVTASSGRESA